MPKRPCLVCRRLHSNPSRCDDCQSRYNSDRGSSTQRGYGVKWRGIRRTVLADWLAAYGSVCPGYGVPGHASDDLTVDHIVPKARGGPDDRTNLMILCRGCNSRKRDR